MVHRPETCHAYIFKFEKRKVEIAQKAVSQIGMHEEKSEDSHVAFGQLKEPPHKSFPEIEQTGMPDHPAVSRVKRFVQCGRGNRRFAFASSIILNAASRMLSRHIFER